MTFFLRKIRYFSNRREKLLNHTKKTFLFIILDVLFHSATPAQDITLLSQLVTGGAAFGVDYKDDFVYVADWSNDLTIVDAADPYNPSIIGNVGFDGSGRKVRIFGDYAYVTGSYGIHIVDISNPFEASVAGEFIRSSPGGVYPHGVDVKDGKCYISFNAMGLYIVDVSNPENPVELGHFDALDWARDVVVVDSLAYLLNLNNGGSFSDALQYLQVLNISDPNNIYEVGNWTGSNDYAWSNSLIVREDHAYVLGDNGLFVLDITDPTSPQTVGVWNPGGWNFRMSEDGDLLYIAKEGGGMKVVDVSDPTNPTRISTFSTFDYCADVAPRDNLVYIADGDGGLLIVQHTFAQVSIDIDHNEHWNLVGLPLEVEDSNYQTLFPESIGGTLYSYNGAYVPESYLTSGEGYWLRFENSGSTTIDGIPINELTISLSEGWNLVSGISETVSISSVSDPDGIIVSGTLYGYDGAYLPSEELMAGKGYWLRANSSGSIALIGN